MYNFRKDFPVFTTHPDLVYLDSASTTQKPAYVIDEVAQYLRSGYANIHRGAYRLSEISEQLYIDSKKAVARYINAQSLHEIVYTTNATGAFNLLVSTLELSGKLQK